MSTFFDDKFERTIVKLFIGSPSQYNPGFFRLETATNDIGCINVTQGLEIWCLYPSYHHGGQGQPVTLDSHYIHGADDLPTLITEAQHPFDEVNVTITTPAPPTNFGLGGPPSTQPYMFDQGIYDMKQNGKLCGRMVLENTGGPVRKQHWLLFINSAAGGPDADYIVPGSTPPPNRHVITTITYSAPFVPNGLFAGIAPQNQQYQYILGQEQYLVTYQ